MQNSFFERVLPYRERAAVLAVGLSANKLMDWLFNYLLYPYVIYTCGIIRGGVIMILASMIACLLKLQFYDWSKHDWLGIEAIKNLKEYSGARRGGRMTAWFLKRSEIAAFLFLTMLYDPFVTATYLRRGRFNGMMSRDWWIFYASLLIGNVPWILACYMGITLVEWAWRSVKVLL